MIRTLDNRRSRRTKRTWHASWAADRIRFYVKGTKCQHFLTACGISGIKLWKVHCVENGYVAWALGANVRQLQQLAAKGGWTLEIGPRNGPGQVIEQLCTRPGILVGLIFAIALLKIFALFVWNVDFGTTVNGETIRGLLFECEIVEGAAMNEEKLQQANQTLQREGQLGWVSLHFSEGCLFVETNALHQQQIKAESMETALYSKSDALILSMDVQGGFAAVEIGQYVTKGQLLVDNAKFGRTGTLVKQEAEGRVIGRVMKTYNATYETNETQTILSGKSRTEIMTYFMGRRYGKSIEDALPHYRVGFRDEYWEPLRIGQLVLPGCRKITTKWNTQKTYVKHTAEYSEAMAKRRCHLQLAEEFPDAIVESQETTIEKDGTKVTAVCRYTLRADLAQRGAPPEHVFVEPG